MRHTHGKGGSEPRDLALPVGDERGRNDEERAASGAGLLPEHEQGDDLQRLAETHVVGEAAAEAEAAQEGEPAERVTLVVAELSGEGRGGVERRDAAERRQLVAHAREPLVD
ncbi:hypothetical protein D3C83_56020 [compost metagenome]